MTSARLRATARTGALSAGLLVLAAAPAGAVTSVPGLDDGCRSNGDGTVICRLLPASGPQRVHVPAGVHSAVMSLRGGAGGAGTLQTPVPVPGLTESPGGPGGTATATIPLVPGSELDVRVGGAGLSGVDGGAGGPGGGGNGNTLVLGGLGLAGGGGGGASEVRIGGSNPSGADPLIAAGGGGGGGSGALTAQDAVVLGPGGAGGGTTGEHAPGVDPGEAFGGVLGGGGTGGTPTAGGEASGLVIQGLPPLMGGSGVRGQGGDAGMFTIPTAFEDGIGGGGGGGGGYFGGSAGSVFAGGGGGSGFGPDGTEFGVGPADARDGEVVIVFAAPIDAPAGGPRPTRQDSLAPKESTDRLMRNRPNGTQVS
ncbi:hypothetical protein GCM10009547_38900 [Sporichthya brevicatena]|uniref:Glycine rich protein n=1 Tax=Sporichthya brevicatena TaxID=171442 RepID=A0ABN1H793_9ACTN